MSLAQVGSPLPFIGQGIIWSVHVVNKKLEKKEKQKVFERVRRLPVYPEHVADPIAHYQADAFSCRPKTVRN